MQAISPLKYLQLSWFSHPVSDRIIYRTIRKFKVRSILEIGMGSGRRAENMIQLCHRFGSGLSVRYTGVDMFEERSSELPPLHLIQVHKKLSSLGAKTQLVPGTLGSTIGRIANSHVRTDMILISAGHDPSELEANWFFFPRMLHAESLVFVQSTDDHEARFKTMNRLQVERVAKEMAAGTGRRSHAA